MTTAAEMAVNSFLLDTAVSSAQSAQKAALRVEARTCGVMYPFGTLGEAACPVCNAEVFMHLGFPDQRDLIDR